MINQFDQNCPQENWPLWNWQCLPFSAQLAALFPWVFPSLKLRRSENPCRSPSIRLARSSSPALRTRTIALKQAKHIDFEYPNYRIAASREYCCRVCSLLYNHGVHIAYSARHFRAFVPSDGRRPNLRRHRASELQNTGKRRRSELTTNSYLSVRVWREMRK